MMVRRTKFILLDVVGYIFERLFMSDLFIMYNLSVIIFVLLLILHRLM